MAEQHDPKKNWGHAERGEETSTPDNSLGNQTNYGDSRNPEDPAGSQSAPQSQDDSTAHSNSTLGGHDAGSFRSPFGAQDAKANDAEKGDEEMSITKPVQSHAPNKGS